MLLQLQVWALMLLQEAAAVGFDPMSMWNQMGWLGKAVVIALFIMSAWSIGVMIDRFIAFNAARKQSRAVCPGRRRRAARRQARRSDQDCRSLQEEPPGQGRRGRSAGVPGAPGSAPKSPVKRSKLQARSRSRRSHRSRRTEARHQQPGDHRFHGSVRRTVRNGRRHHQRVQGHRDREVDRSGRGRRRYFGSACHHRRRSVRGHPRRLDVQLLHRSSKRSTSRWATPARS